MSDKDDNAFDFADTDALRTVVVRGVVPISQPGLAGLRTSIDKGLAWPYFRLVFLVIVLITLMGVTGEQSMQDTFVFSVLALAVAGVLIVMPALVRRLGEQPEGRPERPTELLDLVSLAISPEKLLVARSERSGLEVDERLRPRLRADLALVLRANRGLDLANPDHHIEIETLIGHAAWAVVREDRANLPIWEGLPAMEFTAVLQGCLASLTTDSPQDRTPAQSGRERTD